MDHITDIDLFHGSVPKNGIDLYSRLMSFGLDRSEIDSIRTEVVTNRKITAIKALRTAFHNRGYNIYLKEAKETVDALASTEADVIGWFVSLDGGATWQHTFVKPLVREAFMGGDLT